MVMNVDVRRQANPTLAVIDGGLNVAAGVPAISTPPKPKLLDQVCQAIRVRHYSPKTEDSYVIGSNGSSFSTTSDILRKWRNRR
jgi:hypothetical protein